MITGFQMILLFFLFIISLMNLRKCHSFSIFKRRIIMYKIMYIIFKIYFLKITLMKIFLFGTDLYGRDQVSRVLLGPVSFQLA